MKRSQLLAFFGATILSIAGYAIYAGPGQSTQSGVVQSVGEADSEAEPGLSAGEEPGSELELEENAENAAISIPTRDEEIGSLLLELDLAEESAEPYDRAMFKHWTDEDGNGCDTRREVLISEALVAPIISTGCDLSGGEWRSLFDGLTTSDASSFDVDHMVPLKEAWQSGADIWDPDKREAFANDLDLS